MTPQLLNSAVAARSPPASDPVCDCAAAAPWCVRPDFTASTGLPRSRATCRANIAKRLGFPKLSR